MNNVYYGLRAKQKETFDVCLTKKYGIISDTCGSGKSRIQFELLCHDIKNNLDKPCFLVLAAHRLDLIDQHLDNFKEYVNEYHPELINQYEQFEISSANRSDKNILNTTKRQFIQNILRGAIKPTIITVCYHSLQRLYESFFGSQYRITRMICDEGHYGMSGSVKEKEDLIDEEQMNGKYACITFCDSFLVFTATPFKQTMVKTVDKITMNLIHDYTYAEAVKDEIVLPFKANFYTANYSKNSALGMIETAYNELKKTFNKTSAKLLVCGTGLESNQLNFNSLIKKYKKEIENGNLAIAKIGSESETENNEKIPSCEWVDSDQLDRGKGSDGYKLCFNDERKNKYKIFKAMHDWINPYKNEGKHKNIIIIHCQMLGVGVDVPNLNGVCILGNKESADLYQSIMRPCRIANFDRNVEIKNRLEDHFEVYIHAPADIQTEIKKFTDKLISLGGISMLDALTLNSVTGSKGKDTEETAAAKVLYDNAIKAANVISECETSFNINDFESGLEQFLIIEEKYPEHKDFIESQIAKFIKKIA